MPSPVRAKASRNLKRMPHAQTDTPPTCIEYEDPGNSQNRSALHIERASSGPSVRDPSPGRCVNMCVCVGVWVWYICVARCGRRGEGLVGGGWYQGRASNACGLVVSSLSTGDSFHHLEALPLAL